MVIGHWNVCGICQETLGTPVDTSKLQSTALNPLIQTVPGKLAIVGKGKTPKPVTKMNP